MRFTSKFGVEKGQRRSKTTVSSVRLRLVTDAADSTTVTNQYDFGNEPDSTAARLADDCNKNQEVLQQDKEALTQEVASAPEDKSTTDAAQQRRRERRRTRRLERDRQRALRLLRKKQLTTGATALGIIATTLAVFFSFCPVQAPFHKVYDDGVMLAASMFPDSLDLRRARAEHIHQPPFSVYAISKNDENLQLDPALILVNNKIRANPNNLELRQQRARLCFMRRIPDERAQDLAVAISDMKFVCQNRGTRSDWLMLTLIQGFARDKEWRNSAVRVNQMPPGPETQESGATSWLMAEIYDFERFQPGLEEALGAIAAVYPDYGADLYHANLLLNSGRFEQAVAKLTDCIAKASSAEERPPLYLRRALCYRFLGNARSATDDFKRVADIGPESQFCSERYVALAALGRSTAETDHRMKSQSYHDRILYKILKGDYQGAKAELEPNQESKFEEPPNQLLDLVMEDASMSQQNSRSPAKTGSPAKDSGARDIAPKQRIDTFIPATNFDANAATAQPTPPGIDATTMELPDLDSIDMYSPGEGQPNEPATTDGKGLAAIDMSQRQNVETTIPVSTTQDPWTSAPSTPELENALHGVIAPPFDLLIDSFSNHTLRALIFTKLGDTELALKEAAAAATDCKLSKNARSMINITATVEDLKQFKRFLDTPFSELKKSH